MRGAENFVREGEEASVEIAAPRPLEGDAPLQVGVVEPVNVVRLGEAVYDRAPAGMYERVRDGAEPEEAGHGVEAVDVVNVLRAVRVVTGGPAERLDAHARHNSLG